MTFEDSSSRLQPTWDWSLEEWDSSDSPSSKNCIVHSVKIILNVYIVNLEFLWFLDAYNSYSEFLKWNSQKNEILNSPSITD